MGLGLDVDEAWLLGDGVHPNMYTCKSNEHTLFVYLLCAEKEA